MQIRRQLKIDHVAAAVCEDVRRRFGDSLPPEWKDLVCAAVYPGLAAAPDSRGSTGLDNFLKCWQRDTDLTLKILSYARKQCAKYHPHNCWFGKRARSKAALVKAALLNWRGDVVKQNGDFRPPTIKEAEERLEALRQGKRPRLKFVPVDELTANEIADWLNNSGYEGIKEADVKEARQQLT